MNGNNVDHETCKCSHSKKLKGLCTLSCALIMEFVNTVLKIRDISHTIPYRTEIKFRFFFIMFICPN